MSLLAALAKGLGAGTLQNAKAGFDEQTRQKEENRRQAEIREQISASKDESTREWQKRDEQLNKQIAAGKDELNTRLTAEAKQAAEQRAHDLAMLEKKLAVATKDAALQGSYTARKENADLLMKYVDRIQTQKKDIMDSDTLTPEQKTDQMAKVDMLGVMLTQDPYAQVLLKEHGGGGYVDYYASMMPSQNQPPQGGEPTSAPGRPGGSGGGGATDVNSGSPFSGSFGGSRAANPPLPTAAEALSNHPIEIGPSGYPTNTPQFRGTSLLQMTDQIDSDIGTTKAGANPSGLIRRMQDQGRYGYPGY